MSIAFTPRPLERNLPGTSLEGAFRVHLPNTEFRQARFSNGDLVRVSTLSGGPKGVAIAWLTTDKTIAKGKPIVRVTDLLREKFDISLNDKIFVEKTDEEWKPITSIELSFADSMENGGFDSTEELMFWTRSALGGTLTRHLN